MKAWNIDHRLWGPSHVIGSISLNFLVACHFSVRRSVGPSVRPSQSRFEGMFLRFKHF